jgi:hypothetical protein
VQFCINGFTILDIIHCPVLVSIFIKNERNNINNKQCLLMQSGKACEMMKINNGG